MGPSFNIRIKILHVMYEKTCWLADLWQMAVLAHVIYASIAQEKPSICGILKRTIVQIVLTLLYNISLILWTVWTVDNPIIAKNNNDNFCFDLI